MLRSTPSLWICHPLKRVLNSARLWLADWRFVQLKSPCKGRHINSECVERPSGPRNHSYQYKKGMGTRETGDRNARHGDLSRRRRSRRRKVLTRSRKRRRAKTEASCIISNPLPSPGSRPTPWQAATRFTGSDMIFFAIEGFRAPCWRTLRSTPSLLICHPLKRVQNSARLWLADWRFVQLKSPCNGRHINSECVEQPSGPRNHSYQYKKEMGTRETGGRERATASCLGDLSRRPVWA